MVRKIIINIAINGLILYLIFRLFPTITYTGGSLFFAVGGIIMGLLNSIVKPILKLLTFPLQLITLGLSLIILNGVIFWLFDQSLDILALQGITLTVPTLKSYFLAGFVFGIINWLAHLLFKS